MADKNIRPDFAEVDVLHDPDGTVAVITSRVKHNGRKAYSFMLAKEFDRDGQTSRTCWLSKNHLDALRRLLDRVESRLELEEDRDRAAVRTKV